MNNFRSGLWYGLLALAILSIDRITKWYALTNCFSAAWHITPFFSCDVVFNRGLSWGLLYAHNAIIFGLLSWCIVIVTLGMAVWATIRAVHGYSIVGEICVIAGSLANIADRFIYHGVIDFLILQYNGWTWPAFNIADMSIIGGIFLMLLISRKQ